MAKVGTEFMELMKIIVEWLAALGAVFAFGNNCGDDIADIA